MSTLDHSVLERLGALLQQRVSLVGLAAFGSWVRSDNRSAAVENDSDLDVLVISETLTPDVRRIVSEIVHLNQASMPVFLFRPWCIPVRNGSIAPKEYHHLLRAFVKRGFF